MDVIWADDLPKIGGGPYGDNQYGSASELKQVPEKFGDDCHRGKGITRDTIEVTEERIRFGCPYLHKAAVEVGALRVCRSSE
jgi:hypothetical protein